MTTLDFNCDLGEGCGNDAAILPWISSASIACGGHTGDATSMREAIARCLDHGVAIGAHPSFEDREYFGRRALTLPPAAIETSVRQQITALAEHCTALGAPLRHVKPHGALYNLAAHQRAIADAIVRAIQSIDASLILYGLANSCLTAAGEAAGLRVAHEVFAERAYDRNGQLAPRGTPGAVIESIETSLTQVRQLLRSGHVTARDGAQVPLRADTLCLHGDRADAPLFARALHEAITADHIHITAPFQPL